MPLLDDGGDDDGPVGFGPNAFGAVVGWASEVGRHRIVVGIEQVVVDGGVGVGRYVRTNTMMMMLVAFGRFVEVAVVAELP